MAFYRLIYAQRESVVRLIAATGDDIADEHSIAVFRRVNFPKIWPPGETSLVPLSFQFQSTG